MNLSNTKIEIITCDAGDWVIVKVDDKIFDQGHSVNFVELLKFLGYEIKHTNVSDDEMIDLAY